ncbi:tol-pal system-associated acyl-CoA thioesterase [Tritonibacter mobilis]|uniref:tol-pal system-associated acyl-CoA thioesterase n=1 Tax=Tritonibacter mobilis TaxID=379347 RepID=UPI0014020A13|nr:tol-pal system-associated acyl-CoA thioesterase [Tritonibacter mobilis]NHM19753.1 tol-pal system-associated acyl-CoA thioesterase [Tritonibacter mobilis]NHM23902.1 tol-pal system-associated acyl-CoA thioesterase [Tritonibacter mobilis]NKX39488.1 tol-pal system-associated acyl-CoA thioesterase [Rhodobacteraceae bacterium R_SAG5]
MTHQFPITVYYEDTDMGGVVYHANFLRFIERARSDYVRRLGVDQNAMRGAGIVWVVTRIEADYLSPARFEDELTVETVPEKMTTARLTMSQIVRREGRELFRAKVTAVCMDMHSGKPVRLPAEVRASL